MAQRLFRFEPSLLSHGSTFEICLEHQAISPNNDPVSTASGSVQEPIRSPGSAVNRARLCTAPEMMLNGHSRTSLETSRTPQVPREHSMSCGMSGTTSRSLNANGNAQRRIRIEVSTTITSHRRLARFIPHTYAPVISTPSTIGCSSHCHRHR